MAKSIKKQANPATKHMSANGTTLKPLLSKKTAEDKLYNGDRYADEVNTGKKMTAGIIGKKITRPIGTGFTNISIMQGNAANKAESQLTVTEKMNLVLEGVSKKELENLKEKTALGYEELAKGLSVTKVTLINKKGNEKFNAGLSERIVAMADIYSYGYEVFEDEARFNKWMFKPNQALAGKMPYDLMNNQFGREEVKNIIGRIDYGVYA